MYHTGENRQGRAITSIKVSTFMGKNKVTRDKINSSSTKKSSTKMRTFMVHHLTDTVNCKHAKQNWS